MNEYSILNTHTCHDLIFLGYKNGNFIKASKYQITNYSNESYASNNILSVKVNH